MKYLYSLFIAVIFMGLGYASKPPLSAATFFEHVTQPQSTCWVNYSLSGFYKVDRVNCSEAMQTFQNLQKEDKDNKEKIAVLQVCRIKNGQPVCGMSCKDISCEQAIERVAEQEKAK